MRAGAFSASEADASFTVRIGLRAFLMLNGPDLFCALGTSTFSLKTPGFGLRVSLSDELRGWA